MDPRLTKPKTVLGQIGEDRCREFEEMYPGLLDCLEEADKEEIDSEDYTRRALNSVKNAPEFLKNFSRLDTAVQKMLQRFMDGESAEKVTKGGFKAPRSSALKHLFSELDIGPEAPVKGTPITHRAGDADKPSQVYENKNFINWGQTVKNTPRYTFVLTTVAALQDVIKKAISEKKSVRAAGFRHTWTDMYSQDDQILVSLIDLSVATGSSSDVSIDAVDGPPTEFNQIQLYNVDVPNTDGKKRWARVGAGVSNEAFRRWSVANGWTLPYNVIMVEISLGGSNAPICHGAGITHKTLSDLVREIEYVDTNGEKQSVSDPEKIKAAAGAFGLLGIVTHLTFELDKMTYAMLGPLKQDVRLAIPPPAGFEVPATLKWEFTEEQRKDAESVFIQKANCYYSEWFWFAYQNRVWVNCWDNTEDATDVIEYPSPADTLLQWAASTVAAAINSSFIFKALPGRAQGLINGKAAMAILPSMQSASDYTKTALVNGLHFRRGIQNFPIRDVELEIPIPPLATDPTKPDWSVVQRAWWDAIAITYDDMKKTGALRVVLELRIMGSSDIIMAPQSKNKFGTASIEVITNIAAADDGSWKPFVQKLVNAWTSYEFDGKKLNVRPHWAKEWEGYEVDGVDWKKHLKEVSYKDEIAQFKDVFSSIGGKDWEKDTKERFSNPLLNYLFFD